MKDPTPHPQTQGKIELYHRTMKVCRKFKLRFQYRR